MTPAVTASEVPPNRPDLTLWAINICIALGLGGFAGAVTCILSLLRWI